MNRFTRHFLILSAVATLGTGAVLAQPGPGGMHRMEGGDCHAMPHGGGYGPQAQEHMLKRHEQHQTALKTALKLTPEQEGAWKQFTDTTRMDPKAPTSMAPADWDKLTTPQRLEKMQAMHKQRDERMGQHAEAVKQFYATLTPEQQKTFDQQHMMQAHPRMQPKQSMPAR